MGAGVAGTGGMVGGANLNCSRNGSGSRKGGGSVSDGNFDPQLLRDTKLGARI